MVDESNEQYWAMRRKASRAEKETWVRDACRCSRGGKERLQRLSKRKGKGFVGVIGTATHREGLKIYSQCTPSQGHAPSRR